MDLCGLQYILTQNGRKFKVSNIVVHKAIKMIKTHFLWRALHLSEFLSSLNEFIYQTVSDYVQEIYKDTDDVILMHCITHRAPPIIGCKSTYQWYERYANR